MKKLLCFVMCIILCLPLLVGCGGFFTAPELEIASISSELLEDGRTKITISYTDMNEPPLEFYIDAGAPGEQGEEGAGIAGIEYQRAPDGKSTLVVITYTDSRTPTTFTIPDGMYSVSASVDFDELTGSYYVLFTYSDGTQSEPFYIGAPIKGDKGDKGNGIKVYSTSTDADGNIVLHFEFDEGEPFDVTIPRNLGIAEMSANYDEENYYIEVTYNNGTTQQLVLPLPTKWYYGNSRPGSNIGRNGDYYFDEENNVIYRMIDDSWVVVVELGNANTTCTVTFNLNDSNSEPAEMRGNYIYTFNKGECFASNNYYKGNIPIPTRAGYEFDGWYTKAVISDPLTTGIFTDLTPISSDITLYAKWVEK